MSNILKYQNPSSPLLVLDNSITDDNYNEKIQEMYRLRAEADSLGTRYTKADSLGKEIARYTLDRWKDSNGNALNYGYWAGTEKAGEPEDIDYLIDHNIRIEDNDVVDFLQSYVNSEGFNRIRNNQINWWKSRHPYQKYLYPWALNDKKYIKRYKNAVNNYGDKMLNYTLDGYPSMSFSLPYQGSTFTYRRRFGDDKESPYFETQMHEFDHLFNIPASSIGTINSEVLDQNTNTKKNGHDEYRDEKHSDNLGIKYLLFKEGIYDARGNKDITPEQIQQLRDKYPKLRFLQQLNNENAAFQINHVTQNTTNQNRIDYRDPITFAKKGGRIHIKKKNRGKFTAAAKRAGMGVQEFARHVLANKNKYSSTLVKRANFARNSKKFKHENGGILKAQEGTGNLLTPHPLSPVGIALNQAKAMVKMKGEQQHLPPGVKEVVGPDGKKVAIRTEQPLVPLEQSIAEWLPGTGDVAEVGYIADDVKNGRYGSAALTAAMVALPGNVGKILRKSDIPASKSTKVVVEESKPRWANTSQSKLSESERLGIPKGERNQPGKPRSPRAVEYDVADGRPTKEFLDDYHAYAEALKTGGRHVDITDMFDSSWYRQRLLNQGLTEEQADQLILRLKDRVSPENLVIVDGLNSVRNFRRIEDGIPVEMTPERLTLFGRHTTGPGLFGKSLIELSTKSDPEEIILHEIGGHRSQPLVADFKNIYLDQALTNLGLQRHMKIGKTADYGLNWGEVRARALTIAKQMSDAGWNPNSPEQVNVWLNKHIFTNSPKNANQGALYYDRPRFIKAVSEGLKNGGKL